MRIKTFALRVVLPAVMVAAIAGVLSATALAQSPANQIAGSWQVAGTPDPHFSIPQFINFATITADGQVVNIDPGVGTSVGAWRRLQGRVYFVTFTGFLDPSGARYVVATTITLDQTGQQASGRFLTRFLAPNGFEFFQFEGSLDAVRQGP